MPILITLFRALFWIALPVSGAACAGVYYADRARRDLTQEAAQKTAPEAKQPVAPGLHFPDA